MPIPRIAPFVLARIAGLPLGRLIEVAPSKTTTNVDDIVKARLRAESLRPALEDALYAAISLIHPRSRNVAIELKRSIHNSRSAVVSMEAHNDLLRVLPVSDRDHLNEWLVLQHTVATRLVAADAEFETELQQHIRPRLHELWGQEEFLRPLVLASRSLFERISHGKLPLPNRCNATKVELSLLAYLIRASAKTSPFSTFMHVALFSSAPTDARAPNLDQRDRSSRCVLNRGIPFKLRRGALGCCGVHSHGVFQFNESLRWIGDAGVEFMAPDYATLHGRIFRVCRRMRLSLSPCLRLSLSRLPSTFCWSELLSAIASAEIDSADSFAQHLYQRGLIEVTPPLEVFAANPFARWRSTLSDCATSQATQLSAKLDEIHRDVAEIGTCSSSVRASLLSTIHAHALHSARLVKCDLSGLLRNPVVEDGFFRTPYGSIGPPLHEAFLEIASALQPTVQLRPSYAALRELYRDFYGSDGHCYDVEDFLCRAMSLLGHVENQHPAPNETSALRRPVPVTVFAQALESLGPAVETTPVAVINQIYSGCGWLSARHAVGSDDFHAALRKSLKTWLRDLTEPAEPVDLLLSADCNPLQIHPRLTERVLVFPGEPARIAGGLGLRDVWLRLNGSSGLLEMMHGENVIAPVYLGTTFPNPALGPLYWLTVLALPWRLRPLTDGGSYQEIGDDVWHSPRRMEGRVVVGRAAWRITRKRLQSVWFRHNGVRRLADVATYCSLVGIPRLFFARTLHAAEGSILQDHKPMWIDSRNPFMLDLLCRMSIDAESLLLTEALPVSASWPRINGSAHVSEWHIELAL